MKKSLLLPLLLALPVAPIWAQDNAAPQPTDSTALMDRVSTAYGTRFAQRLAEDGLQLNIDKFAEAFKAVAAGKPLVTEEQIAEVFKELNTHMESQAIAKNDQYLQDNAKKEGVKTTASGLQYEVLKAAEGPKPAATSEVTVHYEGKLISGQTFDSSVQRGEPATFGLDQVIPGWTEGLQLMSKGSKFRFTIPSKLAYGDRGAPPDIPGHSTLVFEVELLEIKQ